MSRLLLDRLGGGIPHLPLCDLPTPVQELRALREAAGTGPLWVKRDDLSGALYGGNKPRKLEWLLADALERGCEEVVAMGGDGSNHCLATTLYGRRLGLGVTLITVPQPPMEEVRDNLLLDAGSGARLRPAASDVALLSSVRRYAKERARETGKAPYLLWLGGSQPRGCLGFVEAALELKAQVDRGELPAPARIYVPLGSGGSHAGLLVGLALAGLDTEVRGVRVSPRVVVSGLHVRWLARRTVALLRSAGLEGPLRPRAPRVLHDHFGGTYGLPTEEGERARELLQRTERLATEPTYSAKALAAMLAEEERLADGRPALFWLTYSSADTSALPRARPDELPGRLRSYWAPVGPTP